ncbi:Rtf2 RING-finger-domain-containing protein [Jimgerdemannia flammicorona]|nr:Rtf2 RING-finger-domain-containing protein [Jimgerdemannia flammicorona]
MGNDGGSIPKRTELVKEKQKEVRPDQNVQQVACWFFCALSKVCSELYDLVNYCSSPAPTLHRPDLREQRPLESPVVSCALGKLYNRDAIIEYLLDRTAYGDGDRICSHIDSIKDVRTLTLTPNPTFNDTENGPTIANHDLGLTSRFVCPLSLKEMNGKQRFVYLETCGCVFSEQALKEVPSDECVSVSQQFCYYVRGDGKLKVEGVGSKYMCGVAFKPENIIVINATRSEEIEGMKAVMEEKKARAKAEKKEKKKSKSNAKAAGKASNSAAMTSSLKRKADGDHPAPQKKISITTPSDIRASTPTAAIVDRVTQELAEKQKKKEVSSAIKSIYKKGDENSRGNYLTKGTFTRYA